MQAFFDLNRPILLFVYGQAFFVMGLAIFLQSRRHSRLSLARALRWLAAFGILHALHEWGLVFIPIQAAYLPVPYEALLQTIQVLLLALSFTCLLVFGVTAIDPCGKRCWTAAAVPVAAWLLVFWLSLYPAPTLHSWHQLTAAWARYLLGFPAGMVAAFGLRHQARARIAPLGVGSVYRSLRAAGLTLAVYAVLGGLVVSPASFFPANVLNTGIVETLIGVPVEVFRSLAGLVLAVSIIRALELFEIELDRRIESMEVERIRTVERDRIGQEIHDGAMQGVYSANLILESMQRYAEETPVLAARLEQARRVLENVITDLRRYMVSLRAQLPERTLEAELQRLAMDPRFASLADVSVHVDASPDLSPEQTAHLLAVAQQALANAVRHAQARQIKLELREEPTGLLMRIIDDGRGFDQAHIRPGFGLRAMRDHARLLDARLSIHSQPGKGTVVEVVAKKEER